MTIAEILATHPGPATTDLAVLARCVEECAECAADCTICADSDLAEADVAAMARCIRLCLDCADTCVATGRIVSRQTEPDRVTHGASVEACIAACRACAEECDRHAHHHEHCRLCAEECRRCVKACEDLLAAWTNA